MAYLKSFSLACFTSQLKTQLTAFAPGLSVPLVCPDCRGLNPTNIEGFRAGDLVYAGCGLVLGGRVADARSEWRFLTRLRYIGARFFQDLCKR